MSRFNYKQKKNEAGGVREQCEGCGECIQYVLNTCQRCNKEVCRKCGDPEEDVYMGYYKGTVCRSCVKKAKIAEDERKVREAARIVKERNIEVFKKTMVRIEIGDMCYLSSPCMHNITAFDKEDESCDMGTMGALRIQELLAKLGQPVDKHIEESIAEAKAYREEMDAKRDEESTEFNLRCKEWGFADM